MADIPNPITRKDQYLSYLTGNTDHYPTDPITREEKYLYYLCVNGIGGGGGAAVTPEQIQAAVDAYLEDNPVSADTTKKSHGTSDTTFQLPPNELHTWGEVPTLTLTLGAETSGEVNEYLFAFDSGATATTLSLPESVVTDIVVEPNTHYECSIIDNYMTFHDWGISA